MKFFIDSSELWARLHRWKCLLNTYLVVGKHPQLVSLDHILGISLDSLLMPNCLIVVSMSYAIISGKLGIAIPSWLTMTCPQLFLPLSLPRWTSAMWEHKAFSMKETLFSSENCSMSPQQLKLLQAHQCCLLPFKQASQTVKLNSRSQALSLRHSMAWTQTI